MKEKANNLKHIYKTLNRVEHEVSGYFCPGGEFDKWFIWWVTSLWNKAPLYLVEISPLLYSQEVWRIIKTPFHLAETCEMYPNFIGAFTGKFTYGQEACPHIETYATVLLCIFFKRLASKLANLNDDNIIMPDQSAINIEYIYHRLLPAVFLRHEPRLEDFPLKQYVNLEIALQYCNISAILNRYFCYSLPKPYKQETVKPDYLNMTLQDFKKELLIICH